MRFMPTMWVDPHLRNACIIYKVSGSVPFYDTKIRLVKVKTNGCISIQKGR